MTTNTPSTSSTTSTSTTTSREQVASFVDAVIDVLVDETEVARDRLAKKRGVEASSRFYGSRKSLAAILADQAEFKTGKEYSEND